MTFIIHIRDKSKLTGQSGYLGSEAGSHVIEANARRFSSLESAKAVLATLPTSKTYVAAVHIATK
jgi:hypothetical protein